MITLLSIYGILTLAIAFIAWRATKCNSNDPILAVQKLQGDNFDPNGASKDGKRLHLYCTVCNGYVNEDAKHCGACNRCSGGFDHHCNWLNNCIGETNYWDFYNLIVLYLIFMIKFIVMGALAFYDGTIFKKQWMVIMVSIIGFMNFVAIFFDSELIHLHRWMQ